MVRKSLSKKIRFEVFKRDAFTCQYCGRKAPDVILEVDHIEPVSKGGTNDLLNLVTSCKECNAGKGDRRLDDSTVLGKRRAQLEELQQRKEQIDMMFQWYQGLENLEDEVISKLVAFWEERAPGWSVNESGIQTLRKLRRRFDVDEIMEAMRIAADQYLEIVDGEATSESWDTAFSKIGGICATRRRAQENPNLQRLYYIRAIARKRCYYFNEALAIRLLEEADALGIDLDWLEEQTKMVRNWTEWRSLLEDFIHGD